MPNQETIKRNRSFGKQLFEALTQQEIAQLLDALVAVLPLNVRDQALDHLKLDTRQIVQRILSEPATSGQVEAAPARAVSTAKLEQTWNNLWQEWDEIVDQAAQEEGRYITQEAHWEPPYFSESAFIDDLEEVARKMRPLLPNAVEDYFLPGISFAEALAEAEAEIAAAMPEWIYLEGFYLEENLTWCVLEWEWLKSREEEQDAFAFAERILDWEESFSLIRLGSIFDFFTQLPEPDQQLIFKGLTQSREAPAWKKQLDNARSDWHAFYMSCIEQYAPERYLDSLRDTIPQQWQNGLPVIEDLLAQKDYPESLKVIKETLAALSRIEHRDQAWSPESGLLVTIVSHYYNEADRLKNHKQLLDYYQQTAQGLNQTELVNALRLQLIAFDHCFSWETMFKAFEELPLSPETRQTLFESWQAYIISKAKPYTWSGFGSRTQPRNTWWLHWLIESIADKQKGPALFQQQVARWLAQLPGQQASLGEDFDFLRLLTKDLTAISGEGKSQYPRFYQVVIRFDESPSPDQSSRQKYLKQYASPDLLAQVMVYWKANLQNFVPRPESAQKSDYTSHAHWLAALRELAPDRSEALLNQWRTEHHRRRNLWQALGKVGLG